MPSNRWHINCTASWFQQHDAIWNLQGNYTIIFWKHVPENMFNRSLTSDCMMPSATEWHQVDFSMSVLSEKIAKNLWFELSLTSTSGQQYLISCRVAEVTPLNSFVPSCITFLVYPDISTHQQKKQTPLGAGYNALKVILKMIHSLLCGQIYPFVFWAIASQKESACAGRGVNFFGKLLGWAVT